MPKVMFSCVSLTLAFHIEQLTASVQLFLFLYKELAAVPCIFEILFLIFYTTLLSYGQFQLQIYYELFYGQFILLFPKSDYFPHYHYVTGISIYNFSGIPLMSKASDKIHKGSQASICSSTFSIIDSGGLRPPELPEHI